MLLEDHNSVPLDYSSNRPTRYNVECHKRLEYASITYHQLIDFKVKWYISWSNIYILHSPISHMTAIANTCYKKCQSTFNKLTSRFVK